MSAASICTTQACTHTANYLLSNLSPNYTTIDPCVDFDQYASGGFPLKYPSVTGTIEATDVMDDNTTALLTSIVACDFPSTSEV
jgi:endothelin-converting enzyme